MRKFAGLVRKVVSERCGQEASRSARFSRQFLPLVARTGSTLTATLCANHSQPVQWARIVLTIPPSKHIWPPRPAEGNRRIVHLFFNGTLFMYFGAEIFHTVAQARAPLCRQIKFRASSSCVPLPPRCRSSAWADPANSANARWLLSTLCQWAARTCCQQ